MAHPIIEAAQAYWQDILPDGASIPFYRDFDILGIPPSYWKSVSLVAVEYEPDLRFRYIVFGSANTSAYGDNLTGKYLDEIDLGGNSQKYHRQFSEAALSMHPIFEQDSYVREDGNRYGFEGGCFPLMGEDGRVSHLLLAMAVTRNKVSYGP